MQGCFCESKTEDMLEWFVQLIAPVLLGAKPAEILSFPWDPKQSARLERIKNLLTMNKNITLKEFTNGQKCTKLFVYNPKALQETLSDKRNLMFLKKLGYPTDYHFEEYVELLLEKIQNGSIPDEIGVFLGYPLKDVMGFIGHRSLKLTKVKGWRVYGDPKLPDRKYEDFMQARAYIKEMLSSHSPSRILMAI